MDYRNDNPCDHIGPVLGPQQDLVQHTRALPHLKDGRIEAGDEPDARIFCSDSRRRVH